MYTGFGWVSRGPSCRGWVRQRWGGCAAGRGRSGGSLSGFGLPVGVAGVAGGHHDSFAAACGERPTVVGFQPMVVVTQPVEFVESRVAGVSPVAAMIDLGEAVVTALHRAGGLGPQQRHALVGGGFATVVSDVDDLFASAGDELYYGVAE